MIISTCVLGALQVWKLPLNQPGPGAVPPPIIHVVNPVPERLFVYAIDFILPAVQRGPIAFCNFEGRFIFPSIREVVSSVMIRMKRRDTITHFSSSSNSLRSGKNSLGSRTARIPMAARKRNESPSSSKTSHNLAQASNGRWSRNSGISQSGR